MKNFFLPCILFLLSFMVKAQNESKIQTITINKIVWMKDNLNTDRFRNGDLIPEAKTTEEWIKAEKNQQPAWCYYENNPELGKIYGKLYNWYAVNDPRGLAPEGWHVSSAEEWYDIIEYLGGDYKAGGKLKSKERWLENNKANNSKKISALPGGERKPSGLFGDDEYSKEGQSGHWWTSEYSYKDKAVGFGIYTNNDQIDRYEENVSKGKSVRCVKD